MKGSVMFSEEFKRAFKGDSLVYNAFHLTLKKYGLEDVYRAYTFKYFGWGTAAGMVIMVGIVVVLS